MRYVGEVGSCLKLVFSTSSECWLLYLLEVTVEHICCRLKYRRFTLEVISRASVTKKRIVERILTRLGV